MAEAVALLFVSIFKVQIGVKQCIDNSSVGGPNFDAGNGFRTFACHYTPNPVSERRFQKLMDNNMTCPITNNLFDWICVKKESRDTELELLPPVSQYALCSTDEDCRWLDGVKSCDEGHCKCIPTLLYSPTRRACIRCTNYSSAIYAYPRFGIYGHTIRVLRNVSSQQHCSSLCINEKAFYCKAAEYLAKNFGSLSNYKQYTCLLYDVSYYEVETGLTGSMKHYAWTLLLRGCM